MAGKTPRPIGETSQSQGREMVARVCMVPAWRARLEQVNRRKGNPVYFDHVDAEAHAFVAAALLHHAKLVSPQSRVWFLTSDLRAQENLANDLLTWHGNCLFFPEHEQGRAGVGLPDQDTQAERLAILHQLSEPAGDLQAVVVNVASLEEEVPHPQALQKVHMELRVGQRMDLAKLISELQDAGYEREPQAAERGQFAVRGGIVDVYSWHAELPLRVEFFDSDIESLRHYDPDAQTSIGKLTEASILLSAGGILEVTCPLVDCIKDQDWVVAIGLEDCPRATSWITTGPAPDKKGRAENFDVACHGNPLGAFQAGDFVLQEARREAFRTQLVRWKAEDWGVEMYFNNEGEIQRFHELAKLDQGLLECRLGQIHHGFSIPGARLAVLCDAELFGRYQTSRARRIFHQERKMRARRAPLDIAELQTGDYVVHLEFGIGRFRGLIKRAGHDGLEEDVLVIEYRDESRLYVPLPLAHLVSRYAGGGKKAPELSSLGDGKWAKTRKNAEKSIYDYAAALLRLQAERQTGNGFAHPPDTKWQLEFENSFIYKETADQLKAIADTKHDMENVKAMDRLICGDVGFGKTEVAIRAAFKAVMSGKQVALLCPTTVLAQQHHRTLRERMSDYPVKVELLNRFRSAREIREVVKALEDGSVDICVGTHRLISRDVKFKNLGLVIVDEEQRFGVKVKERFKELFRLVDVLTLSATPIPRTLYLSLMGARDMSTIDTPPANRFPVETTILAYDERVIKKAIERELKRQGQVYFLHNRVQSIESVAEKIRNLVPQARVEVGHGQMDEGDLEETMQRFISGGTDVLVATTIIESGIDIPNANTIIIDRADRFGLADLYQLRGRVGRAGHKAHAYLMLPSSLLTTNDARKRINAIKQYSTLGSGFKIAMRDLEIRGAGNLLGTQQSGHVAAIGFDLYCQVLKHAVASLKGQHIPLRLEVALKVDFLANTEAEYQQSPHKLPAFISSDYMEEAALRIAAYKELAGVVSTRDLAALVNNWKDRFGAFPNSVSQLLRCMEIKLAAYHRGITSVEIKDQKLMLVSKGDYIMINGKFPRLNPAASHENQLLEALEFLRK